MGAASGVGLEVAIGQLGEHLKKLGPEVCSNNEILAFLLMNRNTQGQTEMCVCVSLSKTSMVAGTFDHKLAHTLGSRLKAFEDLL